MCSDERETRRKYPQAEARAAEPGADGGWVILAGRGPMAEHLGRGDTRENAWSAAARLARAAAGDPAPQVGLAGWRRRRRDAA